jgi:hypothetical protein
MKTTLLLILLSLTQNQERLLRHFDLYNDTGCDTVIISKNWDYQNIKSFEFDTLFYMNNILLNHTKHRHTDSILIHEKNGIKSINTEIEDELLELSIYDSINVIGQGTRIEIKQIKNNLFRITPKFAWDDFFTTYLNRYYIEINNIDSSSYHLDVYSKSFFIKSLRSRSIYRKNNSDSSFAKSLIVNSKNDTLYSLDNFNNYTIELENLSTHCSFCYSRTYKKTTSKSNFEIKIFDTTTDFKNPYKTVYNIKNKAGLDSIKFELNEKLDTIAKMSFYYK